MIPKMYALKNYWCF